MNDFEVQFRLAQAAAEEARFWTIIGSVLFGAITATIGSNRGGSPVLWFVVGAVLGPFGVALPLWLAGVPCRSCRQSINQRATVCPYCRNECD
jgi:uncharacterized membrane protein YedE/YeeE